MSWVQEVSATGGTKGAIELDAAGITHWVRSDRKVVARWEDVFGVAMVPDETRPQRAFVLAPRRPPDPPWFEVRADRLPPGTPDLHALAQRVRERLAQRGYRDMGPTRPLLDAATLMERVIARKDVPGMLEVPVAAGPGGWWRRSLDLFAGGSAGGLAGLYAGALTGSLLGTLGLALGGAVVGGALPVVVARNWRSVRRRSSRPRVLVLAPDGCVVGLPTGPQAFGWPEIEGFTAGTAPVPHQPTIRRPCLEVVRRGGQIEGRIDAAWFAEPLPLIVAVAEAYRARQQP